MLKRNVFVRRDRTDPKPVRHDCRTSEEVKSYPIPFRVKYARVSEPCQLQPKQPSRKSSSTQVHEKISQEKSTQISKTKAQMTDNSRLSNDLNRSLYLKYSLSLRQNCLP